MITLSQLKNNNIIVLYLIVDGKGGPGGRNLITY